MSAKQAINDKLQGSVATYLSCGGVVNNQIKKGFFLSLSEFFTSVNIWRSYKQECDCFVHFLRLFVDVLAERASATCVSGFVGQAAKDSEIQNTGVSLSRRSLYMR